MTTLLIVDRFEEERNLILELLSGKPEWKLLSVASAREAKDKLHQGQVTLVLIDLSTAGPGEERFLDHLRLEWPQIPTLLLTTDAEEKSAVVEALGIGAAYYVPKSQLARDLMITVERLLGLAGCRRRHARLLECLTRTECSFVLENNDLSLIPILIGHLLDTAEDFGVTTQANRMQLAVALDEAIINGLVHGNLEVSSQLREDNGSAYHRLIEQRRRQAPYGERLLHVLAIYQAGEVRFTIRDDGQGFDPAAVSNPTSLSNLDKPHGRGLFLIRAFMSEVLFNDVGNQITLVKRLPQ